MKRLLFFVDEGGFDDFRELFQQLGFAVDFEDSQRKAVKLAKQNQYDALVAEFSYNPEFRDRVSNIESLLATLQKHSPTAKIVILYDSINQPQLEQLKARYKTDSTLALPVTKKQLQNCLV
ncbi:MAG: hypothetical protein FXV79_04740 [Candidatus Thioglobus sp.]|nr:MAG: hypothetical protein FXV80_04785 [Candidatus Thioglobus sp.]KAA0448644.1 MAG: hypothetical protein FXV79_04740 [Candidatus Thioglobus sp.]